MTVYRTDGDGRAVQQGRPWVERLTPLAFVALVLAFFAKMAFSNLILARGDTFLYFYPYWQMAADALRAGHLPYWNPNIFMGVPFLANSQVGFFYPLNWPVWLLLETPYAVSASILIHVMIAGLGAYVFGRRGLHLSTVAALLAAVLFALGGYLTAQVEHINQVQGLSWLPWLFVAAQPVVGRRDNPTNRARWLLACLMMGGLFALQLLAGHTQSAFISGVALSLWLLVHLVDGRANRHYVLQVGGLLVLAVILACLLAAVQLLPTLELTRYSARQGGLSVAEVLSFSWHPLLVSRSVLPSYGQSLFTEYVAFLPMTALLLAVIGVWRPQGRPEIVGLLVLVIAGLVLALGRFTPVYWLLANLPGFDLFRVPARWLVLYAFGTALLAGVGWDALAQSVRTGDISWLKRPLLVSLVLIVALMVWGFAAGLLAGVIPIGPEAPYEQPNRLTLVGWVVELVLLGGIFVILLRAGPGMRRWGLFGLAVLSTSVLWLASRDLPYNNLTTPEAYFDVRPPAARLQTLAACEVPGEPCRTPPDRFLSLSDIFFDPGDQAEIDAIYADQLDTGARYDYTIAIKQKEIIAPNLPMVYGLYAVDGFDGGILPLAAYSDLMGLILPEGEVTADGRLREYLTDVPDTRWLDLFNTRYVITDKVGDLWRQGVFFDRQFSLVMAPGEAMDVGYVPSFESDAVWLLSSKPPLVEIVATSGRRWELAPALREAPDLYQAVLPEAAEPARLTLRCPTTGAACDIQGVTLVDSRDDVFQPVVPGPFRQLFSGDVKIVEYLEATPRAWLVHDWQWQTDISASLAAMQAPAFDPRATAVVVGAGALPTVANPGTPGQGQVTVVEHLPERVTLAVSTEQSGLVFMADANYPGWEATLDGQPATIYQTNGLFRGLFVSPGEHEIVFHYESSPFRIGLLLTGLALLVVLVGLILLLRQSRRTS